VISRQLEYLPISRLIHWHISTRLSSKVWAIVLSIILLSCQGKESLTQFDPYTGPLRTLNNAVIIHSDSARMQGKLITPQLFEFEGGDRELPNGGYVEFYDEFGVISATLKAEYGFYTNEDEEWKIEGNVVLENIQNKESLNTEQLFWNPLKGTVHTEKFVRIERADEILTGTGLTAKQDFSSYVIKKPEGTFNLDE
jgi:LPS export ABC transporter protein LptC